MKMILKYHDRSLLTYVNQLLKENYKLREDIDKIDYNCSESDLLWLKNIFICPPNNNELKNIITEHFSHIELYHTCLPKSLKA